MTATATPAVPVQYIREEAPNDFLAVFDAADSEHGIHEALGRNPSEFISDKLWNELNPDDDPTPEVEYANAQAALLGAKLCRVLIDDPELLRYRARWLEQWAADIFAKHAPVGRDA